MPVIFPTYNRVDKARIAKPNETLDFWLGFVRGTCMSEVLFRSFAQHFSDTWNASARGAAHEQASTGELTGRFQDDRRGFGTATTGSESRPAAFHPATGCSTFPR